MPCRVPERKANPLNPLKSSSVHTVQPFIVTRRYFSGFRRCAKLFVAGQDTSSTFRYLFKDSVRSAKDQINRSNSFDATGLNGGPGTSCSIQICGVQTTASFSVPAYRAFSENSRFLCFSLLCRPLSNLSIHCASLARLVLYTGRLSLLSHKEKEAIC